MMDNLFTIKLKPSENNQLDDNFSAEIRIYNSISADLRDDFDDGCQSFR